MKNQIFFILVGFAFLFVLYLSQREPRKKVNPEQRAAQRQIEETQKQAAAAKDDKKQP